MKILFTQKKEGKKDNPELIGDYLSRIYKVKGDKVPPAYPCESEILVILCFENYGKIDQKLVKFCQDLSTARAHNVALVILSRTAPPTPANSPVSSNRTASTSPAPAASRSRRASSALRRSATPTPRRRKLSATR